MPASRWQTSFQDIMQWNDDEENELLSLIVPSMFSKTFNNEKSGNESDPTQAANVTKYPDVLPILPAARRGRLSRRRPSR